MRKIIFYILVSLLIIAGTVFAVPPFPPPHVITFGDAVVKNTTVTGFHASNQRQTANIAGVGGNNPVVRKITIYISTDPGAGHNEQFRVSFYNDDGHTEDGMLWDDYFNLVYTEVKTATISAAATSGDVDSTTGFVARDKVRFIGGTAETEAVTAVTDSDTLAFTATSYDHAVDEGVVRVYEYVGNIPLYDADLTSEIHIAVENVGTALTGSTSVYVAIGLLQ